ncbi:MAG: MBL fold metallo-hydrolase [Proteobacteria bacterium]|nr:MBL fold metallo-hydrolase [Pseudomonadota bacterium]MBU4295462.1 MBL fold metallo-hydrolase [Pseudomonadota bacterium]MCG2747649.1 MBL fold metallo-hydrolase [Desulfobulbaceae bacterium]
MIDKILSNLDWLGHDCFRLRAAGQVVYFDPFQLSGDLPPADIILVSHAHYDHFSPDDIKKIRQKSTLIITEPESAAKLSGNVQAMHPGQSITWGPFTVEAVPAYNTNKKFHPQANNWLGYIVTVEGVRIYHAGDTDRIPEMANYQADIALLPVSGTYVMTADEAAQAALDINPKVAIPMHFGAIVGEQSDAERFAAKLVNKIKVHIPQKK